MKGLNKIIKQPETKEEKQKFHGLEKVNGHYTLESIKKVINYAAKTSQNQASIKFGVDQRGIGRWMVKYRDLVILSDK